MKFVAFFLLLFSCLLPQAQAELNVPALSKRVTDLTATLDANQVQALESKLAQFEASKGTQFAVLIVPSTQPETIEQFSIRVVEAWKLGRKGMDDGALLLVAKEDRTLRIEVGYGLEGALNDATAHRIINELMVPYLRQDDYYQAINVGLEAMIQVASGEPLPPPRQAAVNNGGNMESLMFGALIVAAAAGGLLRSLFGRLPAALMTAGLLGGAAWIFMSQILVALLIGGIAFVFVLLGGTGIMAGGGGFGGGMGGRGGMGGGWGGGGGGFGGGGASGRW